METLITLMDLTYSIKIRGDAIDQICWRHKKSGVFEVKSFYRVLCSRLYAACAKPMGNP